MEDMKFDTEFWKKKLKELGYKLSESYVPTQFLRDKKAVPTGISLKRANLVFQNPLSIDIVILEMDKLPTRLQAANIARYWKEHQAGRQLMVFTDGQDSYATVIPGTIESPETKLRMLSLSVTVYITDEEALESLRFTDDMGKLREHYDKIFLPYEKIRKDFFEGYRSLFDKVVNTVKPFIGEKSTAYAQRFLGRLMFIYFLQKKGWLQGNRRFVDSIKDYSKLNWVFYVGLSNKGTGLPYLDGTLFEREEYLSEEVEANINEGMNTVFIEARNLFNQYNFTVDELSPKEVEVSLDPGMIGTIFENMLPENERGAKGTFYTPPEEVSFISRRALAAYLELPEPVSKSKDGDVLSDGIDQLIRKLNEERSEKSVREIRQRILSITVLDPAVGSGGFLLGMMQEMVNLLRNADESVGWNTDVEEYKNKILQNLFGFDIEEEAIEIARLRLWLSLLVDSEEPEALPGLDLNIVHIYDSLVKSDGVQRKLGDENDLIWDEMKAIRANFYSEKDPEKRAKLRRMIQDMQKRLEEKYGVKSGIIESWVPKPVDIIVMNPPYVRQEMITKDKKEYYLKTYIKDNYKIDNHKMDKKFDLYCYFVLRSINLLNENGIACVISSDKWLETGYGMVIQKKLSSSLIAVYGQRERTFGADVNSVIYVYSRKTDNSLSTNFVYLEKYSSPNVLNFSSFVRKDLKPGKWFYLRAPRIFTEKIFPMLDHKLGDFAEIKFGIKTGANDFFYMKDISSKYEADHLANSQKFEEWGVGAKNEKELKDQGLIYIENEGGEKFVIDNKDVKFLVRTTKELDSYKIGQLSRLCLYTKCPGIFTRKYIDWGEKQTIHIRGREESIIGYNNVQSVSGRKKWYSLNELEPSNIILPMYVMDRFFIPMSENPVLCDHTLYTIKSKVEGIGAYLNSTIFYMTMELYLRRLGGGVGEIMVDDYEEMPVPNLKNLDLLGLDFPFHRNVKRYFEEIQTEDRKELDEEIIKRLSIDVSLEELYNDFVELVEDRLIKADRPLKSKEDKIEQDN